ncbi:pyrroline-5-carboxylate reductase 3-like isoform X2 [Homarus americanus]|uniref:pyrroline-5-carboxylate reductase 3-like isoform X2 n=1 Tax=Homarus americanus TaxID=6706 RepID=UPI001C46A723|nr:pyrroline-5-carboxylate reductase 3-like isoform X2 [Homarus americanus]
MGKWKTCYNESRKYKKEWEEQFKWLTFRGDKCYCKVCNATIKTMKTSNLDLHEKTAKHMKNSDTKPILKIQSNLGKSNKSKTEEFEIKYTVSEANVVSEDGTATSTTNPAVPGKEVLNPANIGFIGCGNMAQALLNAFIRKGLIDPSHVMASAPSDRNLTKLRSLGVKTTHDNNEVVKHSDVIFLCVKPHHLTDMIGDLNALERSHNPLFVSIITGFDIKTLEEMLTALIDYPRVIRLMPNTPSMVGQGCCVYTLGSHTPEAYNEVMNSMLSSIGLSAEIPEYQMDAACGLAGSGPAYIYAAIEALADGGVKMGLPRQLAQTLAAQMVKGAATMVLESGKHPGQLKDEVCSPGGTTIAAMHSLEKNGLRNALISAVEASALRSKELGTKK